MPLSENDCFITALDLYVALDYVCCRSRFIPLTSASINRKSLMLTDKPRLFLGTVSTLAALYPFLSITASLHIFMVVFRHSQ